MQWRSPSELISYHNNPKLHPQDQIDKIASSINEYGFSVPLVVDGSNVLVCGHGRLAAAKKLNLDKVPVIVRDDLSSSQLKAFRVADNKVAESGWDMEALKLELEQLVELDTDLELTGFDSSELDELLELTEVDESGGDVTREDDELPEEETIQQRVSHDQVWSIGDHLIMCGDCRDANDVKKLLGNHAVNVAMTSPPYASQRKYDEESGFKPIPPDEYVQWFDAVQDNVKQHLAKDGSFFINIKEHCEDGQRSLYVKDLTIAHVRQWKWRFVDEFCWVRQGVPGKWENRFKNGFEPVFHFCKSSKIKLVHENVMHLSDAAFTYTGDEKSSVTGSGFFQGHTVGAREGIALPSNVLKIPVGNMGGDVNTHSATYPIALPEFFIKAFSDEGDRIYDPFCGSGTTLVAAHKHGRIGLGMEISEKYCNLILTRMEQLTGEEAILVCQN